MICGGDACSAEYRLDGENICFRKCSIERSSRVLSGLARIASVQRSINGRFAVAVSPPERSGQRIAGNEAARFSYHNEKAVLPCPDGEIGRRSGLKIRRPQGRGGSSPPLGTKYDIDNKLVLWSIGSQQHFTHLLMRAPNPDGCLAARHRTSVHCGEAAKAALISPTCE